MSKKIEYDWTLEEDKVIVYVYLYCKHKMDGLEDLVSTETKLQRFFYDAKGVPMNEVSWERRKGNAKRVDEDGPGIRGDGKWLSNFADGTYKVLYTLGYGDTNKVSKEKFCNEARAIIKKRMLDVATRFDFDNTLAFTEGWSVVLGDGCLVVQRVGDTFKTDAEARKYVIKRGSNGSEYHKIAARLTKQERT